MDREGSRPMSIGLLAGTKYTRFLFMKKITIPIPNKVSSNSSYSGQHWRRRKKIVDEIHEYVWAAVHSRKYLFLRKYGWTYPLGLLFKFFNAGRQIDVDNLSFMCKCLIDGLVAAEVIEGDSPKYIKRISIEQSKINLINEQRVEISIDEI